MLVDRLGSKDSLFPGFHDHLVGLKKGDKLLIAVPPRLVYETSSTLQSLTNFNENRKFPENWIVMEIEVAKMKSNAANSTSSETAAEKKIEGTSNAPSDLTSRMAHLSGGAGLVGMAKPLVDASMNGNVQELNKNQSETMVANDSSNIPANTRPSSQFQYATAIESPGSNIPNQYQTMSQASSMGFQQSQSSSQFGSSYQQQQDQQRQQHEQQQRNQQHLQQQQVQQHEINQQNQDKLQQQQLQHHHQVQSGFGGYPYSQALAVVEGQEARSFYHQPPTNHGGFYSSSASSNSASTAYPGYANSYPSPSSHNSYHPHAHQQPHSSIPQPSLAHSTPQYPSYGAPSFESRPYGDMIESRKPHVDEIKSAVRMKSEDLIAGIQQLVEDCEKATKEAKANNQQSIIAKLNERIENLQDKNEKLMSEKSSMLERQADLLQRSSDMASKAMEYQQEVENDMI